MKNYILYLSYGTIDYLNETLFSLVTFYKYHEKSEIEIILYTDNVSFFKNKIDFPIAYYEVTNTQIKAWSGSIAFNHRTKIKVLEEVTSKFDGNFLFVDSDTHFLENCSSLFLEIGNGTLVLDKCEGKLSDNRGGIAKKLRRFFKNKNSFSTTLDTKILFDEQFIVWNTGTIGLNSKYKSILPKVLELVDVLYSQFPIFVMEQIAFSYYFQAEKKPISSEKYIHHYWYFKEFRMVLNFFFKHNHHKLFSDLIVESYKINPAYLSIEKRKYRAMTFWQKQIHKVLNGRKWKIMDYEL